MKHTLTGPDEVTSVESHRAELEVTTTSSDGVDSLVSDLGVRSRSTELELSLLLVNVAASTSSSILRCLIQWWGGGYLHTCACDGCREKFPFNKTAEKD